MQSTCLRNIEYSNGKSQFYLYAILVRFLFGFITQTRYDNDDNFIPFWLTDF